MARELREHPELPQLRRAPMPMLTSVLTRFARAGWTVADVVAAVRDTIADRVAASWRYKVETAPVRQVQWLTDLLIDADLDVPPAQAAAARAAAAAEQRRVERARADAAAAELAAAAASPQSRAAAIAAAREQLAANARAAGRVVRPVAGIRPRPRTILAPVPRDERPAAALAALDAAIQEQRQAQQQEQGWPEVAQPGAGLPARNEQRP
jgi:hypothetical protein